ncbi:hypothetical protein EOT10_17635 [Streptomyces antnestii]|uniref:DUF8017 domain-containing protein n=2 Tax=Streptomyces antnestii TaxID=2494256 RepID=A0A3S2Z0H6_9ACTN|nr:hypothetical protein [Streptomyces sp. San01]RVU23880.1 hypothetical protein EOT10_17635 [Streptomyces sp. San01]
MWPGEQGPRGEQNPQGRVPNPYRQPNPQPNPPQQPNPYQQPSGQQIWNAPTMPASSAAAPPEPPKRRRTALIAVVAAAAVVVASAVTGFLVLDGKDKKDDNAGPGPTKSSAAPSGPTGNPRAGGAVEPTVAGWRTVVNADHGLAFDVPPAWQVKSNGWVNWVSKDGDPEEKPLIAMSNPAFLEEKWCVADDDKDGNEEEFSLGATGSRGNNGATSTEDAATKDATTWVYGGFTQPDRKNITTKPAESFTTASGLTGSLVTASSTGVKEKKHGKCSSDGKSAVFAFKDAEGDFASWSFFGVKGVKDEVPDATVRKIVSTVRLVDVSDS